MTTGTLKPTARFFDMPHGVAPGLTLIALSPKRGATVPRRAYPTG